MRKFILLISLSYCANIIAQDMPVITYIDQEITVDGKFDEPVWNELNEISGFFNHFPLDEGAAVKQTKVKLFQNGESLFIGVIYQDTTGHKQVGSLKRDDLGGSIGSSDAFIAVIDPYNQKQNAYYFAANIEGAQVDGLVERTDQSYSLNTSWNAKWYVKTSTDGNTKRYEIEIPLKMIGYPEDNASWGLQFYKRDIKANNWSTYKQVSRNYLPYDLRFTESFLVDKLSNNKSSRFTVTPGITTIYQEGVVSETGKLELKPSLDVQYNLTSSLKIDATINPDFSQVDVDQQVTNLTRFAVFFPERRNFFLENSDLFSGLGSFGVNPFYSRRIGLNGDIMFGLKLSGNVAPKTRIGLLNVQDNNNQNFGAAVLEQQLSKSFTGVGYLISRQGTSSSELSEDYNRVAGANLKYRSSNDKWTGVGSYGSSFNPNISEKNDFYNIGTWYNTRPLRFEASVHKVQENYITDVGFVPRLNNYDPVNDSIIREGYINSYTEIQMYAFPEKSKHIDSYRYLFGANESNFDEQGELVQSSWLLNNALWFKNISSVYFNLHHDYVNLKYDFDLLGNNNPIPSGEYDYQTARIGYNSVNNKKLFYNVAAGYSNAYGGNRWVNYFNVGYRLLPRAKVQLTYDRNYFDLGELGQEVLHLTRFTGEVFLSNRLNWTTYLQYNTQGNNFNVNSRVQWEYKPLSYIYLVWSDNYDEEFSRTNWGGALKVNYRMDF